MSDFQDFWALKFKDVSVWHYFRAYYNGFRQTPYKSKWKCGREDFLAFIKFVYLIFKRKKIIAVFSRDEIVDYSKNIVNDNFFMLKRAEQKPGNSFFIESIWFLFRKITWLFFYREYLNILRDLNNFDKDFSWPFHEVKNLIGDYYFNFFLKIFIKDKVYYTNCLIPKIERYMGLHDSYEIQHGVIHDSHFDYVNIPNGIIKNKIIVWSDFWKEKLIDYGYSGEILVENKFDNFNRPGDQGLIVFGTVDNEFSKKIDEFFLIYENFSYQRHPRDYYKYKNLKDNRVIDSGGQYTCSFAVCHDSTLILYFLENNVKFFYLKNDYEDYEEIIKRIESKYSASIGIHYNIINELSEIEKYL